MEHTTDQTFLQVEEEHLSARSSHWVSDPNPSDVLFFPSTNTKWRLGRIFAERCFHGYDEPQKADISEVSATCVATQVEGEDIGSKRFSRLGSKDVARTKPCDYGIWASYEFYNLRNLTGLQCRCTPRLLDYKHESQTADDHVPGGFIYYFLMQKVPGRNLVNFPDLPLAERNLVRLAFARAIREFFALRYQHNDPDRRNLIWDPKGNKCYIIDLEDAYDINNDAEPFKFKPSQHWFRWGLAGKTLIASDGVDPMVPYCDYSIVDPDDEKLEQMVAAAEGKDVYIPDRKAVKRNRRVFQAVHPPGGAPRS